ncbi:TatD family hydrolase [archaeon]|jgi:TatD DNase family protein|nr:TatD family hydrolase [archaeon]
MKLIDVHAHLEGEKSEEGLDAVVDRAEKAGVKVVVNSGVNPETNRKVLELSEKYDIFRASFGMYPIDAIADRFSDFGAPPQVPSEEGKDGYLRGIEAYDVDDELKWIEEHADDCVAIGEIGLDFKVVENTTDEMKVAQEEVFRKVLKLAKKIDKPVVIHSRGAELRCFEILEEMGFAAPKGVPPAQKASADADKVGIVIHCFCGKKSLIKRGVENGWFFSVAPAIKRWQNFQMMVEIVPIEQLLTETDSPFLSPVVGERNESANVAVTIGEIARIKGISEKEVADKIWENAGKLGLV